MEKLRHLIGRVPYVIGLGLLPFALAGCNSFALDDGIPDTAPTAVVVSAGPARTPSPVTKRDTGTYPTFDRQLTAANTQIGDEEAASSEARLSGLARARASGAISEREYQARVAEFRRLAAQHGADAEASIAN